LILWTCKGMHLSAIHLSGLVFLLIPFGLAWLGMPSKKRLFSLELSSTVANLPSGLFCGRGRWSSSWLDHLLGIKKRGHATLAWFVLGGDLIPTLDQCTCCRFVAMAGNCVPGAPLNLKDVGHRWPSHIEN
jgi:hypothetical protein